MIKWRKWNRILHRDIGYMAVGLIIIYSISGIAVNHVSEWNPNYVIEKSVIKLKPIPDSLLNSARLIPYILNEINEKRKYKSSFYDNPNTLNIFVEGNNIVVKLDKLEVSQEKVKNRTVFRETNFLHLNAPKKVWTYVADLFAVALILLALSGLFMIKGQKGIRGRGAWMTAIGIAIPVVFYLIYYYKVF